MIVWQNQHDWNLREAQCVPEGHIVGEVDTLREAHSVAEGHTVGEADTVREAHSVPENTLSAKLTLCA